MIRFNESQAQQMARFLGTLHQMNVKFKVHAAYEGDYHYWDIELIK